MKLHCNQENRKPYCFLEVTFSEKNTKFENTENPWKWNESGNWFLNTTSNSLWSHGERQAIHKIKARQTNNRPTNYRVSHSKVNKVILLCWVYRFWFLLIFWILNVHEIGTFMPSSSVFIELMLIATYGSICKHFLFFTEFCIILNFRGHFKAITSEKPTNG